jgi:hypothetical protein
MRSSESSHKFRQFEVCHYLILHFYFFKKISKCIFKNRVLLSYFAVCGFDVMNKLDKLPHTREELINWVYNHQIQRKENESERGVCGFRGSASLIIDKNVNNFPLKVYTSSAFL